MLVLNFDGTAEKSKEWMLLKHCILEYTLLFTWQHTIQTFKLTLLTKTTATQNEVALSNHRVRGLHLLAVIFAVSIVHLGYEL